MQSWHWIPVPLNPSSARRMSAAPLARLLQPEAVQVHMDPLAPPARYGWHATGVLVL